MSKVILLNGSAHVRGCTATALNEMIKVFSEEGIETELIQVGAKDIRGCISCNRCSEEGRYAGRIFNILESGARFHW